MTAIIGPVQIFNVGGGIVHFGDTAVISPKSASKLSAGSGSSSTGGFVTIFDGINATNTVDTNLIDQPTVGNN